MVRGNLNMLRNMGTMAREELGLEYWFPPLGSYPLNDEVGNGSGLCYLDDVTHEREICWAHTARQHEERPNTVS